MLRTPVLGQSTAGCKRCTAAPSHRRRAPASAECCAPENLSRRKSGRLRGNFRFFRRCSCFLQSIVVILFGGIVLPQEYALVAQPVEHLTFNQRARDSSSLERTKIPRRIARFLVGFSIFWGSAHFCTLFAHRRESRVFPCIVCILCIVSVFSILFSGEQQAGELTPLFGVHLSDNFQHPFRGDLDAVRQIFFYRHRAGFGGADVL